MVSVWGDFGAGGAASFSTGGGLLVFAPGVALSPGSETSGTAGLNLRISSFCAGVGGGTGAAIWFCWIGHTTPFCVILPPPGDVTAIDAGGVAVALWKSQAPVSGSTGAVAGAP